MICCFSMELLYNHLENEHNLLQQTMVRLHCPTPIKHRRVELPPRRKQIKRRNYSTTQLTHKRSNYEWFQYYGALYLRYLGVYRQLEDSFDQMVHPQKRKLMSDMLANVMIRMCEVKQNAIKYSTHTPNPQTDYLNFD